jgi:hypothetical protein
LSALRLLVGGYVAIGEDLPQAGVSDCQETSVHARVFVQAENRKRQDAINRKSMRKTLSDPVKAEAWRAYWREYQRLRYHRLKKKSGRKG